MCTHRRSTMHGSPSLILSALLLQWHFCSYGNGCSAHCTSRFGCRWSTQTWSAWSRHLFWRSPICACSFHGPGAAVACDSSQNHRLRPPPGVTLQKRPKGPFNYNWAAAPFFTHVPSWQNRFGGGGLPQFGAGELSPRLLRILENK